MQYTGIFRGVVCPLVTPLDPYGELDCQALDILLEFLISNGIHGVMVGGSTGEGQLLSLAERKQLLEAVVQAANRRCAIIAHVGCLSTRDTVDLARHARSSGVNVVSAIVPYFYTFDDQSILAHFAALGEAVRDCHIFVYSYPANAKNDLSPDLVFSLREMAPNFVGLKVSSGDLDRVQAYIQAGGPDFTVLLGADGLMLAGLCLGVHGQVSGNSNVFPEPFCKLYDAFQKGDLQEALAQQQTINRIRSVLKDGMYPAYFKAALRLRGLAMGSVRPPMRELTTQELEQLRVDVAALMESYVLPRE